jgi:Flp pilus assembly protein TadD
MFCFKANILTRSKFLCGMLVLSLMLVVGRVPVNAQGGVGSTRGLPESAGGVHRIQGTVYLPSGRRATEGIMVRLEGNVNGTKRASTDGDGSFSFNALPAADYSLTVEAGAEYEPVRQSVVIYGNTGNVGIGVSGQTIMVDIHLQPKGVTAAMEKMFAGVPKAAIDSYKKGMEAAQAGNTKKAIELLNNAVTAYPSFPIALRDLGVQYRKVGDMDKLAETMEALLKLSPDDPHGQLNLGIALYNQKKYPDAEKHLRQAVKLNKTDPAAHYYLGMTLVSTRNYPEAQAELEAAVSNGGDNLALAHKYLGGLYMGAGNPKAADELEKYLKLDPKAADADRIKATIKDLRSKQ